MQKLTDYDVHSFATPLLNVMHKFEKTKHETSILFISFFFFHVTHNLKLYIVWEYTCITAYQMIASPMEIIRTCSELLCELWLVSYGLKTVSKTLSVLLWQLLGLLLNYSPHGTHSQATHGRLNAFVTMANSAHSFTQFLHSCTQFLGHNSTLVDHTELKTSRNVTDLQNSHRYV